MTPGPWQDRRILVQEASTDEELTWMYPAKIRTSLEHGNLFFEGGLRGFENLTPAIVTSAEIRRLRSGLGQAKGAIAGLAIVVGGLGMLRGLRRAETVAQGQLLVVAAIVLFLVALVGTMFVVEFRRNWLVLSIAPSAPIDTATIAISSGKIQISDLAAEMALAGFPHAALPPR